MEIELKDPKPPSLNGFHSPAIRIPGAATPPRDSPSKQSSNYTSLKDILHSSSPSSSSPPAPASAASAAMFSPKRTTSWNEIPIRNPLVKHAAMAYLQPMSTPTASFRGKGCVARLADKCCACLGGGGEEFGCVAWLCDVVSRAAREALGIGGGLCGERRSGGVFGDESDEDDDDDEEGEKVD